MTGVRASVRSSRATFVPRSVPQVLTPLIEGKRLAKVLVVVLLAHLSVSNEGVEHFTLGPGSLSSLFATFDSAIETLAEQYEYPGYPPSMKYAVVGTRSHYLAYLLRDSDVLVRLLKLVTQMVSSVALRFSHF